MEAKRIVLYTRKGVISGFRFVNEHLFLLSVSCLLVILYRCFPVLFGFLLSSSPVIICTALLLGFLLSYGEPNVPEIEDKQKRTFEVSSLMTSSVDDNVAVENDNSASVEEHVEEKRHFDDLPVEKSVLGDARLSTIILKETFFPSRECSKEAKNEVRMASSSLHSDGEIKTHGERKLIEETESIEQGLQKSRDFSFDGITTQTQKESDGLKLDVKKRSVRNQFYSSLGSPWQPIERASSNSESDRAESSSPDASLADIVPLLDELHPLLDPEIPQPIVRSGDDSDAASGSASEDHESDDASAEDVPETHVEEDDDDDKEDKGGGNESIVKWTADDQKNLMDLGSSELERNRRLENLIAKRRARKIHRFEMEKNLIDLDGDPTMAGFQIRPISAIRRNPFDLPYDYEEIPGSAPSFLPLRKNPFDIPDDTVDESADQMVEKAGHHESVPGPPRGVLFRRHESFSVEPSFSYGYREDWRESRFKPSFVTQMSDTDGAVFSAYQGQLGGNSDLKVQTDSESTSVIMDQEDHRQISGKDFPQDIEMISQDNLIDEPIEKGSQSSNDAVRAVEAAQEESDTGIAVETRFGLAASAIAEGTKSMVDAFKPVIDEIISSEQCDSPLSEAGHLDAIEDDCENSVSSSVSNQGKNNLKIDIDEKTIVACSYIPGITSDKYDDGHVSDPVYDSSPSAAVDKTLSTMTSLDSHFLFEGKGGSFSISSLASDMLVETSEIGSPPRELKGAPSGDGALGWVGENIGEDPAPNAGGSWVAPSSLSSIDRVESQSRAVSVIWEDDVIGEGYSGARKIDDPVEPIIPDVTTMLIDRHSSFSSIDTDFCDGSSLCVEAGNQSEADERMSSSFLDVMDDLVQTSSPENENGNFGFEGAHVAIPNSLTELNENVVDNEDEEYRDVARPNVSIGSAAFEVNHGSDDFASYVERERCLEFVSPLMSPVFGSHDNSLLNITNDLVASKEVHAKLNAIEEIDEELMAETDTEVYFHPEKADKSESSLPVEAALANASMPLDDLDLAIGEAGRSHILPDTRNVESTVDDSQLQVVDVLSLEDLHSMTGVPADAMSASCFEKTVCVDTGSKSKSDSSRAIDTEDESSGDPKTEIDSKVLVPEAKPVLSSAVGSSSDQKSSGGFNGDDTASAMADFSSSTKTQKTDEPGKSGSSPSSSSADSD